MSNVIACLYVPKDYESDFGSLIDVIELICDPNEAWEHADSCGELAIAKRVWDKCGKDVDIDVTCYGSERMVEFRRGKTSNTVDHTVTVINELALL